MYLNRDSVCQSPDGHRVQMSISQVCDSAAQHLYIFAAVQLVPQLQLNFANTQKKKLKFYKTSEENFSNVCSKPYFWLATIKKLMQGNVI